MKLTYSLLAAAFACGLASAQTTAYTTPVGYTTETLAAGRFNLVGLTLHNPTVSAGVIASATSNSVTITGGSFDTLLTAGQTYILELANGTVQEITSWTSTTLTTPDDISSQVVGGTTTFSLRKASTISDVFGASNSAGITPSPDGDLTNADKVLILNSSGAFDTVFYFNDGAGSEGWFDDAFAPAGDKVIAYPDSFFVQREAGSPINLVVTGELKKVSTKSVIGAGYNYIGVVSPTGLTLAGSGVQGYITASPDGDLSSADTVLIPQADGSYKTTFYYNDGTTTGWFDDAFGPADDVVLPSAVLIYNQGVTKPLGISVPSSYSSL